MTRVVDPAREGIVLHCAATPFEPSHQARAYVAGDLELDRPSSLLLHDDRASPDLRTGYQIADSDLDQVTANVDYAYAHFSDHNFQDDSTLVGPTFVKPSTHTVSLSLNYRF